MGTVMVGRYSHFGGGYVAECPDCGTVCVYWDNEDLDDDGNLLCHCDESHAN